MKFNYGQIKALPLLEALVMQGIQYHEDGPHITDVMVLPEDGEFEIILTVQGVELPVGKVLHTLYTQRYQEIRAEAYAMITDAVGDLEYFTETKIQEITGELEKMLSERLDQYFQHKEDHGS